MKTLSPMGVVSEAKDIADACRLPDGSSLRHRRGPARGRWCARGAVVASSRHQKLRRSMIFAGSSSDPKFPTFLTEVSLLAASHVANVR